jgi:hypothetical protein
VCAVDSGGRVGHGEDVGIVWDAASACVALSSVVGSVGVCACLPRPCSSPLPTPVGSPCLLHCVTYPHFRPGTIHPSLTPPTHPTLFTFLHMLALCPVCPAFSERGVARLWEGTGGKREGASSLALHYCVLCVFPPVPRHEIKLAGWVLD